ncbi:hypothetical protein BGZ98_000616 [Dissophora globulifera]|nr:hypothetical protein BGZ98_000616 [Dissophora globulifera]
MDSLGPRASLVPSSSSVASDTANSATRKPTNLRNLQPRAAAAVDFNDNYDSEEEDGGLLSADYKAQRKTTSDLVDFFKSDPPELAPQAQMTTTTSISTTGYQTGGAGGGGDDEKKKKSLLQRLRSRKSNSNNNSSNSNNNNNNNGTSSTMSNNYSVNASTAYSSNNNRSSVLLKQMAGTTSNASTMSGVTTSGRGKNGEEVTTATLPNGKKYIMIAVDYKDSSSDGPGSGGTSAHPSLGTASARQSRIPDDTNGALLMLQSAGLGTEGLASRRASMLSGAEESKFLESGPFLLDSLALENRAQLGVGSGAAMGAGDGRDDTDISSIIAAAAAAAYGNSDISRAGSKRASKVTFSLRTKDSTATSAVASLSDVGANSTQSAEVLTSPLDEAVVAEALAQRIASHKAKQQQQFKNGAAKRASTPSISRSRTGSLSTSIYEFPEVILPKPVSRKKVRHVQIQTQHCVMRPMHTQTEPYETMMVQELDVKTWSSLTGAKKSSTSTSTSTSTETSNASVVLVSSGTLDMSTSSTSTSTSDTSTLVRRSSGRSTHSKVDSLVTSFTQPTVATTELTSRSSAASSPITTVASCSNTFSTIKSPSVATSTTAATSTSDNSPSSPATDNYSHTVEDNTCQAVGTQDELSQLRQQNAMLQSQVQSLQRDLAAETRARTRTAVAMQDTRDKFELLSAMAYKKLKEMIFQRHVLEIEVRELRSQVELQNEVSVVQQGEMLFRQEQLQMQQQQHHHSYVSA